MFCRSLFVRCPFILLSMLLRFTDSDYPFGILDLRILITSLWYLQTLLDRDTEPGPRFLASDAVVFIVFSVLWWEMVARFVDIRTIKNGVLRNCLRLKLLEITRFFIWENSDIPFVDILFKRICTRPDISILSLKNQWNVRVIKETISYVTNNWLTINALTLKVFF